MRLSTALAAGALGAALVAAGVFVFVDVYSSQSCVAESGQAPRCISSSATLIETNGAGVLALLAVPVALTAAVFAYTLLGGALARVVAWVATVVLGVGCILTGFSIGMFFLPAAALATIAMVVDRP